MSALLQKIKSHGACSAFLTDLVLGLIEERPGSNVDDLMPDLPEYSRAQVMQALQNLAFTKRALCERRGGLGRGKGAEPGRYYPVEPEPIAAAPIVRRGVSSVWQLGICA